MVKGYSGIEICPYLYFRGKLAFSGALGDEEIAGGNRDLVGKVLSSHNF